MTKYKVVSRKEQILYNKFARYYDFSYNWKNYKEEAQEVKDVIKRLKRNDGNELLEVACGTGNFLKYLRDSFSCTGLDVSSNMLALARKKKISGVTFVEADMTKMQLGKKFDILVCLFGSIAYIKTYQNLKKTINKFVEHLNSGGVVIIDPWFVYPVYNVTAVDQKMETKYLYETGLSYLRTHESDDLKIVRLRTSKIRRYVQTLSIHTLIAEKGKPVIYFIDTHKVGLFDIGRTLEIMRNAGLETVFEDQLLTRGAFTGVKRT